MYSAYTYTHNKPSPLETSFENPTTNLTLWWLALKIMSSARGILSLHEVHSWPSHNTPPSFQSAHNGLHSANIFSAVCTTTSNSWLGTAYEKRTAREQQFSSHSHRSSGSFSRWCGIWLSKLCQLRSFTHRRPDSIPLSHVRTWAPKCDSMSDCSSSWEVMLHILLSDSIIWSVRLSQKKKEPFYLFFQGLMGCTYTFINAP